MSSNPLVSIILVTYNSSQFVRETLESFAAQTWDNVELIVTDDCSKDNTVEICRDWMNKYNSRFARIELITVTENGGIAANCNRGLRAAQGEWLKYCAGDDALLPNCIADNMGYVKNHPEARVLFSFTRMYRDDFDENSFIGLNPKCLPNVIMNDDITAKLQYHHLLLSDCITYTPSSFIHRQTQIDTGGFNEQSQMQEDYPMWLRLTKAGVKLHFVDKETVLYRQHEAATNNMKTNYLIKPNYFRTEQFRVEHVYPNLPLDIRWRERFVWVISQLFRSNLMNRNNRFNQNIYMVLSVYLNPMRSFIYLKKRFVKNLKNQEFYL